MWLLIIGVLLLAAYLAGVEPVASWSWWAIGAPFGLAAAWWVLADSLGWTQRAALGRAESRIDVKRDRMRVAMGLDAKTSTRLKRAQEIRRAEARQDQARRESVRKGQDELLRSSFIPSESSSQFSDTFVGEPRPATGNGD